MKQIALFALLICCASMVFSQVETPLRGPRPYKYCNSVQLELLGSGGAYSINYERILVNGRIFQTAIRTGIGMTRSVFGFRAFPETRIPTLLTEQVSYGRHHLEVGAGVTMMNSYNFWILDHSSYGGRLRPMGALSGGYRYQNPEGRLMLRIAYTPFFRFAKNEYYPDDPKLIHSFGAMVGYAF